MKKLKKKMKNHSKDLLVLYSDLVFEILQEIYIYIPD